MRFRLRTLFWIVAVSAILVFPLEFFLRGPRSVLMGYDYAIQRKYDEIEIGESKSKLLEVLGEPVYANSYFSKQIGDREADFSPEKLEKCKEFVTWINGANWFYCFGIDESGKVVLKADGHS